jgi:aminomethyltransferase
MLVVDVEGPDARVFLRGALANNVDKLKAPGKALYSCMLAEDGGVVDDLIVYFFREDFFRLVVNAGTAEKDIAWLEGLRAKQGGPGKENEIRLVRRDDLSLVAIQGPRAREVFWKAFPTTRAATEALKPFNAALAGDLMVARTGYTGEDGFELYFPGEHATKIWNALTASGEVTPTGLGARDSLRLEMGMALYGNDLDDTTTPLEASLGWLVKMKKGDFVGRDALAKQKEQGLGRKLVGFTTAERSFPRHGYPVFANGAPSGEVRSGTMSPTLGIPIGTAYVPPASAAEGSPLEIEIRGKRIPATVQKMPFYKDGSRL